MPDFLSPTRSSSRRLTEKLGLWHRTLAHTLPSQVMCRAYYRLERWIGLHRLVRHNPRCQIHPPARARLAAYLKRRSDVLPVPAETLRRYRGGIFEYLNEVQVHDTPPWDTPRSRLWRYQLHYCRFIRVLGSSGNQDDQARLLAWTLDWIARHPVGADVAWDAYVISERLLHWLSGLANVDPWPQAIIDSSVQQAEYLGRHIEWDVRGNHVLKNLIALCATEVVLPGATMRPLSHWQDQLHDQLREQVLPEGAHYECSVMYHALLLDDLLLLQSLVSTEALRKTIARMAQWLDDASHPDGDIPWIGDSVSGEAPPPRSLANLARREVSETVTDARATCDAPLLFAGSDDHHLVVRSGAPGPAYQLGHAHCDLLSFELSLGKRRVVVDRGMHGYAGSESRAYGRSTAAHNTVQVEDREQHECWGTFRIARFGRATTQHCTRTDSSFTWCGTHSGFLPFVHQRAVCFAFNHGTLLVLDRVLGHRAVAVTSFLHFDSAVTLRSAPVGFRAEVGTIPIDIRPLPLCTTPLTWQCHPTEAPLGPHAPRFGVMEAAPSLTVQGVVPAGAVFGYFIGSPGAETPDPDALVHLMGQLARD